MPYFDEKIIESRSAILSDVRTFFFCTSAEAEQKVSQEAVTAKWEHSSFSDPGEDWNKLHVYGSDGKELHSFRQSGY